MPCSTWPSLCLTLAFCARNFFLSKQHILLQTSHPESVLFQRNNKFLHAPMAADCNQRQMGKATGSWVVLSLFLAVDSGWCKVICCFLGSLEPGKWQWNLQMNDCECSHKSAQREKSS